MLRAAALRPINVTMLVIGVVAFATTLAWWLVPLTIVTYASLVFLAARDPIFQRKVLGRGEVPKTSPNAVESTDLSPERRARWLPRGETRQKVEAALDVYRKVVAAIETSDDVTRTVLDDAVPRLHAAADRLVDVAQGRERAAEVARDLEPGYRLSRTDRRKTGEPARARKQDKRRRRRDLRYIPGASGPQGEGRPDLHR